MKLVKELSVLQIKNLPPGSVQSVGGVPGLKICVSDKGARSWIIRKQVGFKRREIGLGGFRRWSSAQCPEDQLFGAAKTAGVPAASVPPSLFFYVLS
jgi:hypothetical protein